MFSIQQIVLNKWLLICSLFSVLTVMIVKYYEKTHIIWLLLLALLSEAGLIYGYIQLLKNGDILSQFSLVKILSVLLLIIPSMLFFGSELTTKKIIGLIFAFTAIYLLK